jgi:hypothetical protein
MSTKKAHEKKGTQSKYMLPRSDAVELNRIIVVVES